MSDTSRRSGLSSVDALGSFYTSIHLVVYPDLMGRTNVVVDERLVAKVKTLYGLKTTREAIDFALRALVSTKSRKSILELEGMGWEGDLEAMRTRRHP